MIGPASPSSLSSAPPVMPGFWARVWISPWRATSAGVLLSAAIASILYAFNWHTFYDTRGHMFGKQAEAIAEVVDCTIGMSKAIGDDEAEAGFLQHLQIHIAVTTGEEGCPAGAGEDVFRFAGTQGNIAVQRIGAD